MVEEQVLFHVIGQRSVERYDSVRTGDLDYCKIDELDNQSIGFGPMPPPDHAIAPLGDNRWGIWKRDG
jgi:hypothetical protein